MSFFIKMILNQFKTIFFAEAAADLTSVMIFVGS